MIVQTNGVDEEMNVYRAGMAGSTVPSILALSLTPSRFVLLFSSSRDGCFAPETELVDCTD